MRGSLVASRCGVSTVNVVRNLSCVECKALAILLTRKPIYF